MSREQHREPSISWKVALAVTSQLDWKRLNREAVQEVRRLAAEKLAKPGGNRSEGLTALAKRLGISRQAVALWNVRVPEVHVPRIKRILGIPKYKLRGDKYDRYERHRTFKANGRAT